MSIKPEYYREIDQELRRKHAEFTGVDQNDYTYKLFSLTQQIQRYAKTLAFWKIQSERVRIDTTNGRELARYFFVSQQYSDFSKKIREFDDTVQRQIVLASEEILINNRR